MLRQFCKGVTDRHQFGGLTDGEAVAIINKEEAVDVLRGSLCSQDRIPSGRLETHRFAGISFLLALVLTVLVIVLRLDTASNPWLVFSSRSGFKRV
jgi:hypothetical protein